MSDTAVKKDELKRNVSGFNAYTMVVGNSPLAPAYSLSLRLFLMPQAVPATLGLLSWVIGLLFRPLRRTDHSRDRFRCPINGNRRPDDLH